MVSPKRNKKDPDAEFSIFRKNTNSRKKKKASTLLKPKKIFLFIKNHQIYSKYETQLKSFGAVIVPFLDKDVNYVLTDIPGYNGKSSTVAENSNIVSPLCYSVSPATSVSGDDNICKKSRTRAEAMLERVPTQSQSVSVVNPISNAVSWRIPVYSVDVFQSWLDKKLSQIELIYDQLDTVNDCNTKIFSKRFLKVESITKNKYRPEFREVSKWPAIHINTLAGSCPFDKKSFRKSRKNKNHADKKKESERMNRAYDKALNESGYCEVCAVHYKDLTQHVTESTHLKFVCNDKNYADLDNCIKTRSVEAFLAAHDSSSVNSHLKDSVNIEDMGRNLRKSVSLHLNNNNENSAVTKALSNSKLLDDSLKQPLQVQCNGFTNYHLRKATIKSDSVCYDGKDLLRETHKMYASCPDNSLPTKDLSQLSPLEDETLHRLRSRRNLILPSILIGTTAEDASRHRGISSSQTASSNHYLRSSASPRSCHYATRSKLPNHVNEETTCRKVFNSTVPANIVPTTPNKEIKISLPPGPHFTRSKLNNASPFNESDRKVSPKDESHVTSSRLLKRKPSIASDDDDHRDLFRRTSVSPRSIPSGYHATKKFKVALCNDLPDHHSMNDRGHRKRMSAEEKFLEDNKEYYKVEMLRTKLRSTESYCNREISQVFPCREESKLGEVTSISKTPNESDEVRVGRITKRNSALQLLNLEAEKFMFGPTKNDHNDSDENEDVVNDHCKIGSIAGESKAERVNNNVENDIEENSEREEKTNGFAKQNGRRGKVKKRRTHAELFIHDNLDYYKFEISGSRLRHHTENGESSVKSETNSCSSGEIATSSGITKIKEEIMTDDESEVTFTSSRGRCSKPKRKEVVVDNDLTNSVESATLKDELGSESAATDTSCCSRLPPPETICFSFETVPCKEPWFKVFQRFDTCSEHYLRIPDTVYYNRYRDIRPQPSNRRNTDKQSVLVSGTAAAALASSSSNAKDNAAGNILTLFRRKRRQKIGGRIIIDDKPRKSPRCHASTLAILSSLTSHRRRSRKLHLLDVKKSTIANRLAPVTNIDNKSVASELNPEYQLKMRETATSLAKGVDEHFIDVFGRNDCEDRYLSVAADDAEQTIITTNEANSSEWRPCLQIDEYIFHDDESFKCFTDDDCGEIIGDMATFLDSSQRCNSMEVASQEEWNAPRQNDMLSRLCRENDFSCNSSDCGASSTCEFLGFSEDGQSVSRKRKRKRPNMTGWPHERNKRRQQIRFFGRRRANARSIDITSVKSTSCSSTSIIEAPVKTKLVGIDAASSESISENVSEADSECTDDDLPLTEIINRKKRRLHSVTSEDLSSKDEKNATKASGSGSGRTPSKRLSAKNSPSKTSLPNARRFINTRRRGRGRGRGRGRPIASSRRSR